MLCAGGTCLVLTETAGAGDIMEQTIKKIGREMGIYMSIVMSLFLSLIGTLMSGHFKVQSFILSFLISLMISIVISMLVPMGKVSQSVDRKMNLRPGSMKARCMESLVSDLIYTPIMTVCMVSFAYMMAMKQSHGHTDMKYVPTLLRSLGVSLVVGYLLVFIFQPLFLKMLLKKYNVPQGPGGPGAGKPGPGAGRPESGEGRP